VDKPAFIVAFDQAAALCRDFAQRLVVEGLPTTVRFDFAFFRRSLDKEGRIRYLGGRLLTPEQLRGVEPVQARKYLWVNGKIPRWIDLSVHGADHDFTFIEVHACDRVMSDDGALYYKNGQTPTPLQIRSPPLPPRWISLEKSGKFSLRWRSPK
jgi:hypothetical protein